MHVVPLARYKWNVNYLGTLNAVALKFTQIFALQRQNMISRRVGLVPHERLAIGIYEGMGEATSCQNWTPVAYTKETSVGRYDHSARLIHKLPAQTQACTNA